MLTLNEIYYTITYVLHHSVGDFVIPSSFLSFTDSLVIPSSFPSFTDSLVIPNSFLSFTDNLDFSCLIVSVSSSCLASSGTVCLLSLTYFRILSQEHGYCWYALNSNKVSLSDINTLFFSFLFKIVGPKKKNYIKSLYVLSFHVKNNSV